MRAAVLVVVLASCGTPSGSDCLVDDDCSGGDVCARNGECSSTARSVRVTWTIRGMPASASSCAQTPNFFIMFSSPSPGDQYGYEPVPCAAGVFTVDKLPKRFNAVELGVSSSGYSEAAAFDSQGNAMLDLAP
jgi:hypothetical protein